MKRLILAMAVVLLSLQLPAQEFSTAWKAKFGIDPSRWYYTEDGKYVLGRNEEGAEMLDGATGKSIWKLNFKNDLKVKEIARATYNAAEGVVLFYNPDDKKKNGEKIVVEFATGKELWRTTDYAGSDADDNYHFANGIGYLTRKGVTLLFDNTAKKFVGLDVRTGAKKWESKAYANRELSKNIFFNEIIDSDFCEVYIFNEDDLANTEILYMNIVNGELTDKSKFSSVPSSYSKYSDNKVRISQVIDKAVVKLTGTMKNLSPTKIKFELAVSSPAGNWNKDFEGEAVRQIFNNAPYVKLDVQGDKIFVLSKKISVFDMKSGNLLWEAPYDNCDASAGLKAKQEFGIAGWPLVDGSDVYYVDLQNDNAIKKVDAASGKVIWKTDKLKSNDRVPNITIVNGVLIAQFGGMINTQIFIPNSNGGGVYKNENRFDGNYEVRAYDPATGKVLWSTVALAGKLGDKFGARITSIYGVGNKIVVASDKNLFCLDAKTGDVVYKTSLEASKIGDVFEMLVSDDAKSLYIFCDNGIASADLATGKLNYATKTGEIFWKAPGTSTYSFTQGSNYFVWVGESDFIGFDLAKGLVKGKMKDNTDPQLTADGNSIFVRDGATVVRYQVNK